MIKNIHIGNYALIDKTNIELEKGFTIITGETELPENFQVSGYRYEQNPSGGQYRFFRQLTDHQFAYGLVFLLIVVLLILLLPQFRGLGMLDVLNLD